MNNARETANYHTQRGVFPIRNEKLGIRNEGSLRRAPKNLFDFSGNPNATLTLRMIRLRVKRALTPLGRIASEERARDCAQRLCRLRDENFSKTPSPLRRWLRADDPPFLPRSLRSLGKGDKSPADQSIVRTSNI